MLCFCLQGTAASRQGQEQLLGVLHSQEQHSTTEQQMVGETEQEVPEEEAPMEQVTFEEHEAREEAPEEQAGSSSEDSDEEGAQ
jgi:hypothetical protein